MKLIPRVNIKIGKSEEDIAKQMNDLYWDFHLKFYGRKPTDWVLFTENDNVKLAYKRMLNNTNPPIEL